MELIIVDLGPTFKQPLSVEAAVSALGKDAVLLAGGTWVMRAPLHGDDTDRLFVSLAKIEELHRVLSTAGSLELGALVTHQGLVNAVAHLPEMTALSQAANLSANPSIRRMATIGGNICTQEFAAADLVPAFVALGATVDVQSAAGAATLTVEDYVQSRANRSDEVLTTITIKRQSGRSAHARGLLRQAGEYPVANVSLYLEADDQSKIGMARIAVGSVEELPKRWYALEKALKGREIPKISVLEMAQFRLNDFTPRDGVDAPGSYRLRILPRLIAQAFADVAGQMKGA